MPAWHRPATITLHTPVQRIGMRYCGHLCLPQTQTPDTTVNSRAAGWFP